MSLKEKNHTCLTKCVAGKQEGSSLYIAIKGCVINPWSPGGSFIVQKMVIKSPMPSFYRLNILLCCYQDKPDPFSYMTYAGGGKASNGSESGSSNRPQRYVRDKGTSSCSTTGSKLLRLKQEYPERGIRSWSTSSS